MKFRLRGLLLAAGIASFLISMVHIIIVLIGPEAYRFFGAGEDFALGAAEGSLLPAIVTLFLAMLFFMCALYALALSAYLKLKLPLQVIFNFIIGVLFFIRGTFFFTQIYEYLKYSLIIDLRWSIFSFVALVVGLLYLIPIFYNWNLLFKYKKKEAFEDS